MISLSVFFPNEIWRFFRHTSFGFEDVVLRLRAPDGGGTGTGQVPAAAIGGLCAGDRVRGQLHHAEAVLLRAGKYQPTAGTRLKGGRSTHSAVPPNHNVGYTIQIHTPLRSTLGIITCNSDNELLG